MQQPLVSIITPCYNGAKTIGRMIESVLAQSYDAIEYIIVNDGSTDESEDIILSYKNRIEERGYRFIYIKQKNRGLGGAIDTGLKAVTGEFLCWADADDFYHKDSIRIRAEFLIKNPQYDAVTSDAAVVREGDVEHPYAFVSTGFKHNLDENQMEHLLRADSIFCPGCHMTRTKKFFGTNGSRDIYPARRGQDWQLLLPVYYHGKRGYIDKALYYYVQSENSMSATDVSEQDYMQRLEEHRQIIMETLKRLPLTDEETKRYEEIVNLYQAGSKLNVAYRFKNKQNVKKYFKILKSHGDVSARSYLKYFLFQMGFLK